MSIKTDVKYNGVNPYQEMVRCPKCNKAAPIFMGGYNQLDKYHAILKCKCSHVWTKIIITK